MDQINGLCPVIFIKLCLKHSFGYCLNLINYFLYLIYYPFEQCFSRNVSANNNTGDESDDDFVVIVASNNGSTKFKSFNPNNQSGTRLEKFPDVQSFAIDDNSSNALEKFYSFPEPNPVLKKNYFNNGDGSIKNNQLPLASVMESNIKEEPDYFHDMVPTFTKPKMVYVDDPKQLNDEFKSINCYSSGSGLSQKFRVQEQPYFDLDESKFTNQLGTMEENSQRNNLNYLNTGNNFDNNPNRSNINSWDDISADDNQFCNNINQALETLRKESRERRLKEHHQRQLRRMGKMEHSEANEQI